MNVPFLLEQQELCGFVPVQVQERFDPSFENKYELPEKWLRYETWYVREALLLLSGLDPNYTTLAIVDVKKSIKTEHATLLLGLNCEEEFGEYWEASRYMCEQEELILRERIEREEYKLIRQYPRAYVCEELSNEAQNYIQNARMIACYDRATTLHGIFWDSWKRRKESDIDSTAELEKKYPVATFLKWAVEIKVIDNIPWWTDKLTNKYIGKEETHQCGETVLSKINDPIKTWDLVLSYVNIELQKLGKAKIEKRTLQNHIYNATNGEKSQLPKKKLIHYKVGNNVYTTLENIVAFAKNFKKGAT